jgi:hypothetical protein
MLLAYVLIFVLHLTASTCDGTGRNDHLLFAGRADDATAPSPAIHHHHRYTGKVPTCTSIAALVLYLLSYPGTILISTGCMI